MPSLVLLGVRLPILLLVAGLVIALALAVTLRAVALAVVLFRVVAIPVVLAGIVRAPLETGRVHPARVFAGAVLAVDPLAVFAMAVDVPGKVRRVRTSEAAHMAFIVAVTLAVSVTAMMGREVVAIHLVPPVVVRPDVEHLTGAAPASGSVVRCAECMAVLAGAAMSEVMRRARSMMPGASM